MRLTAVAAMMLMSASCGPEEPASPGDSGSAAAKISTIAMDAYFVRIKTAARQYVAQNGAYPRDVGQLVDQGLLSKGSATDPWGNPWVIEVTETGQLIITSYGADGKPGGTDENRDRVSAPD
jgi:hypothetical protein